MSIARRITVIEGGQATVVFEAQQEKKKGSKMLRPAEKARRRVLESVRVWTDEELERHDRSNQKRKDGWLRDLPLNDLKAGKKALKRLVRL